MRLYRGTHLRTSGCPSRIVKGDYLKQPGRLIDAPQARQRALRILRMGLPQTSSDSPSMIYDRVIGGLKSKALVGGCLKSTALGHLRHFCESGCRPRNSVGRI